MADIQVRHSGDAVKAAPADRIVVQVPENATTGYRWSIGALPEFMEVVSDQVRVPEEPVAGRGSPRVLVFRALRAGCGEIVLDLTRPWEHQPPVDRFVVKVVIS